MFGGEMFVGAARGHIELLCCLTKFKDLIHTDWV